MNLNTFTLIHVLISLVGIATGFVVIGGWLGQRYSPRWTAWFLATTVATSITGFLFPFHGFTPAYAIGVLSLIALAVACYANRALKPHLAPAIKPKNGNLRVEDLVRGWREPFIFAALFALYLNFFVLIVQLFRKAPSLRLLAPTQSEPPFAIAQGVGLLIFVGLGIVARARCRVASVITIKE